ncbi:MAG: N-acetyltransferase [Treponema sp.]|nr:N-acetyltransferase [Treponema sp.]
MIDIKFEGKRSAAYDKDKLIGECDFDIYDRIWTINHTEVNPAYSGQGLAKKLLLCVVEAARKANCKINPVCSYVVNEFNRMPEYYDDVILKD